MTLELPAPGEQPFSLGPSPVTATGAFTNGRGGCPVATSFTDSFQRPTGPAVVSSGLNLD